MFDHHFTLERNKTAGHTLGLIFHSAQQSSFIKTQRRLVRRTRQLIAPLISGKKEGKAERRRMAARRANPEWWAGPHARSWQLRCKPVLSGSPVRRLHQLLPPPLWCILMAHGRGGGFPLLRYVREFPRALWPQLELELSPVLNAGGAARMSVKQLHVAGCILACLLR